MAAQRDYAIGTDDVGPVDAADIEESTTLHLLATLPPPAPALAAELLLGLEPTQALTLCQSSALYQEICDSDSFKERYLRKWLVTASFHKLFRPPIVYHLFRTRVVGDAKTLYERDSGVARTDYTILNMFDSSPVAWSVSLSVANPTAQSSLGGMLHRAVLREGFRHLEFDVQMWGTVHGPHDRSNLTHFFENGEAIELSE